MDREAPQLMQIAHHGVDAARQRAAIILHMAQGQRAITANVGGPHLDIRLTMAQRVLHAQRLTNALVTTAVVNGVDDEMLIAVIIDQ